MAITKRHITLVIAAVVSCGIAQVAAAGSREAAVASLVRPDVQQVLGLDVRQRAQVEKIVAKYEQEMQELANSDIRVTDAQLRFVADQLTGRRDNRLLKVLTDQQRQRLVAGNAADVAGAPDRVIVPAALLWYDPRRVEYIQRIA